MAGSPQLCPLASRLSPLPSSFSPSPHRSAASAGESCLGQWHQHHVPVILESVSEPDWGAETWPLYADGSSKPRVLPQAGSCCPGPTDVETVEIPCFPDY